MTAAAVGAIVWAAGPASAADRTVELRAETFAPSTVTVSEGDTVTFVWDVGFHNVAFDDGPSSGAPVGDAGTTWARTFDAPGTYRFVCDTHVAVGMVGSVTVLASQTAGGDDGDGDDPTTAGDDATDPVVTSYPDTGPEASLLPAIGTVLLVGGVGTWVAGAARRRRARRPTPRG
jgi:plastocyanin